MLGGGEEVGRGRRGWVGLRAKGCRVIASREVHDHHLVCNGEIVY